MNKIIFWDFHGTLAHNDWMFSKALLKTLLHFEPDTNLSLEDFIKKPIRGFPWQDSEKNYLHLTNSISWWENIENIFIAFYRELHIPEATAILYSKEVKLNHYVRYKSTSFAPRILALIFR